MIAMFRLRMLLPAATEGDADGVVDFFKVVVFLVLLCVVFEVVVLIVVE
jgi:hypothetical protein